MKKKRILVAVLVVLALFGAGCYLWSEKTKRLEESNATSLSASQPPQIDPKTIGKVVKEPSTGKEFMSNQIIVEFQPAVSEADSLALIESFGGKMLQRFTAAPLFLVLIEDSGDGSGARTAVKKFASDPKVKSAELNYLTTVN